ncbi:MAG: alkaline phosphatase family protein [Alphaproteobacteria bacterium]|nr:alkaline phosphatase family protein [Alphaproteobacteria bacterium]MCB9929201.1 alkaline phosphatase family protein [Alphaproteobacteria bacterium]
MPLRTRRAVLLMCDGLSREWVSPEWTPNLWALRQHGLWCADHRAVFPSVTRASAASVATGHQPGRHGLHGNRMGFLVDGRLEVRDAGLPDFRDHMRRATGRTLRVPTLAERLGGDAIAFSNVSPGAAYFLDPDHHGHVYHRAGSFGPGGVPITGADALAVASDAQGDAVMVARFCDEVLTRRRPRLAICWQCSPDKTGHGRPLLGPDHRAALAAADRHAGRIAATVERLRAEGEAVLVLVGSDHGMESIGPRVHVARRLVEAGLKDSPDSGDVAVACQGTSALVYVAPDSEARVPALRAFLQAAAWVGAVIEGDALEALGARREYGLTFALDMARLDRDNGHGVPGQRYEAIDGPESDAGGGFAQHGGLGARETAPFLIVDDGSGRGRERAEASSLPHIAPTILGYLGVAADGLPPSLL